MTSHPPSPEQFEAVSPRRYGAVAAGAAILLILGALVWALREGFAPRPSMAERIAALPPAAAAQPDLTDTVASRGMQRAPAKVNMQTSRAFDAAFGAQPPITKSLPYQSEHEKFDFWPSGLFRNGDRYVLVSEAFSHNGSHAGAGHIAVHYLRREGEAFKVTGAWLDAGGSSTWGNPPLWKTRDDLFPNPALELTGSGMWQGNYCEWTALVELTPIGPVSRASFSTRLDNEGAVGQGTSERPLVVITGTIKPQRPGHSFTVRYQGTDRETVRYVRRGETYRPAAIAGPDCG